MDQLENIGQEILYEPEEELSVAEKAAGVFISPVQTFKYLSKHPDFWAAFFIIALVSIAAQMAALPKIIPYQQEVAIENVQNTPGIPDSERQKTIEFMRKIIPVSAYVGATVGTPLTLAVTLLLYSALVFLIALSQGLDTDFKRLLGVLPWVSIISVLSTVAQMVTVTVREISSFEQLQDLRYVRPFSLVAAVPKSLELPVWLDAILAQIDPFYVWSLFVTVIALEHANRCSRSQAAVTTLLSALVTLAVVAAMVSASMMFQR